MNLVYVFFMSMLPLIEQRGAIPLGVVVYGINPMLVFTVSLIGSILPAPFIFIFFNKIFAWMETVEKLDKFTGFIDKKIRKGAKKIEGYTEAGLITFVGIPLPTTGIWTGSAVAAFLGLDFKKSMICVFIGGVISATIITVLSVVSPVIFGL